MTYRFTLSDINGSIVFGTENVANWEEIQSNLTRSESYRGRVRKVTNSFEFVNYNGLDIRTRIMQLKEDYSVNASLTLKIELGDDNFDEFTYEDLGSGYPFKADFLTYNVTETGVSLNFIDSEFQELISAGEKEKLNITTGTTLTGETPTDYTTLLKSIWCHDRELEFNSQIIPYGDDDIIFKPGFYALKSDIQYKSDDNIKFTLGSAITDINTPLVEDLVYLLSDASRTLNVDIDFNISNVLGSIPLSFNIAVYKGDSYTLDRTIEIFNGSIPNDTSYNLSFSTTIDIDEGDSLMFYYLVTGVFPIVRNTLEDSFYTFNSVELQPEGVTNERQCILPHEFFTHWIELMTGRKDGFYSDYFGRTDLGYTEDGEGSYLAIMDGYMLRNMPIEEYPLNAKFKDMVQDAIKEKNLVAGIEYMGDVEVFRIEKYTDVFKTEVKTDIGDLVDNVELDINEDLTYGSIIVGSEDLELEDLNGLNSPQGEVNYSTPLNIDNELDLKTTWQKNDYAIEQQRRLQYSIAPDEDGKFDSDIFIIDSVKGNSTDVLAKTNEGFESITGILAPNKAYNLDLTPERQVRLWGNVINGCLQKEQSELLILTKSATNNTLITQKTGEDSISAGDSILVSDLDTPLIINDTIIIGDAAESKELYDTIESNPNDLFKFTNKGIDYFAYIDKHNYNVSEKKGNFELNRSSR